MFGARCGIFLYALQLNVLEYGMVQEFISDNQPSFVAGLNHVSGILDDIQIKNYFKIHDIKQLKFLPYPSGASFLGELLNLWLNR